MTQPNLFTPSPEIDTRPLVYQYMDRAKSEYRHLIGRPAKWTRQVKQRADGKVYVVAVEHGEGVILGVCGGIEKDEPRFIVHECSACRVYEAKGVCPNRRPTFWVPVGDVEAGK